MASELQGTEELVATDPAAMAAGEELVTYMLTWIMMRLVAEHSGNELAQARYMLQLARELQQSGDASHPSTLLKWLQSKGGDVSDEQLVKLAKKARKIGCFGCFGGR